MDTEWPLLLQNWHMSSGRLLSLLGLLQSPRDWPADVLASRLQVSSRTVRRDIEQLRGLGYRVHSTKGPDGGYRLQAGDSLPPLLFDDVQVIALTIALQVAAANGVAGSDAAGRALSTIRQFLPSRLRHHLDTLDVTAVRADGEDASASAEVILWIGSAIRGREELRFDYAAPGALSGAEGRIESPPQARRAQPHHLVTIGGRWYVVAWDVGKGDWRTFRVDRITPRTPNGPRFTPREIPGGDVGRFVSARFKGADSPGSWPCQGEVILFMPARAVWPYVGSGLVEDLGPEQCRLILGSWSWIGLAAAITRFDAEIEVVGPPELRSAFSELASRFDRAASRRG